MYLYPHALPFDEMSARTRNKFERGESAAIFMLLESRFYGKVMGSGQGRGARRLMSRHPVQEPGMTMVVGRDFERYEQLTL
jgi:hypothetical protein